MAPASYTVFLLLGLQLGAEAHKGKVGQPATAGSWVRKVNGKGDDVGEERVSKFMRPKDHALLEVTSDGSFVGEQGVTSSFDVSCGAHRAATCALCVGNPANDGSFRYHWCHGDCVMAWGSNWATSTCSLAPNLHESVGWEGLYVSSDQGLLVNVTQTTARMAQAWAKNNKGNFYWDRTTVLHTHGNKVWGQWSDGASMGNTVDGSRSVITWDDGITWTKQALALSNASIGVNEPHTVGFHHPGSSPVSGTDWIGWYKKGPGFTTVQPSLANAASLVHWVHACGLQSCTNPTGGGTMTVNENYDITVPDNNTVPVGNYDVYYCADDGYTILGGPIAISVMSGTA